MAQAGVIYPVTKLLIKWPDTINLSKVPSRCQRAHFEYCAIQAWLYYVMEYQIHCDLKQQLIMVKKHKHTPGRHLNKHLEKSLLQRCGDIESITKNILKLRKKQLITVFEKKSSSKLPLNTIRFYLQRIFYNNNFRIRAKKIV